MIAILVDVTRCAGCYECVQACEQANQLGEVEPQPQVVGDGLSANRWTTLIQGPRERQVRKFCQHCLEPACVSVCPVGAMYKTPEGPVLYDAAKCMGCRYCMMACPFGIPRYEWDSAVPLVQKCIFCYPLVQQGQLPACVSACPQGALAFGQREEMLGLARQRQGECPGKYLDTVFGEHDVGGTSVLYLSDVPLDGLLFCGEVDTQPLPALTWNWISKVPGVGLGMGVVTGLLWIIERRMSAEKAQAAKHGGGGSDVDH